MSDDVPDGPGDPFDAYRRKYGAGSQAGASASDPYAAYNAKYAPARPGANVDLTESEYGYQRAQKLRDAGLSEPDVRREIQRRGVSPMVPTATTPAVDLVRVPTIPERISAKLGGQPFPRRIHTLVDDRTFLPQPEAADYDAIVADENRGAGYVERGIRDIAVPAGAAMSRVGMQGTGAVPGRGFDPDAANRDADAVMGDLRHQREIEAEGRARRMENYPVQAPIGEFVQQNLPFAALAAGPEALIPEFAGGTGASFGAEAALRPAMTLARVARSGVVFGAADAAQGILEEEHARQVMQRFWTGGLTGVGFGAAHEALSAVSRPGVAKPEQSGGPSGPGSTPPAAPPGAPEPEIQSAAPVRPSAPVTPREAPVAPPEVRVPVPDQPAEPVPADVEVPPFIRGSEPPRAVPGGSEADALLSLKDRLPPDHPQQAVVDRRLAELGDQGAVATEAVPVIGARSATPPHKWVDVMRERDPQRLHQMADETQAWSDNLEQSVLGDRTAEWQKAQRQQHSSNDAVAQAAGDKIAEIEATLPKEGTDALYGIGQPDGHVYEARELRDVAHAASDLLEMDKEPTEDVTSQLARLLLGDAPATDSWKYRVQHTVEELRRRGVTPEEIFGTARSYAGMRRISPEDAAVVMKARLEDADVRPAESRGGAQVEPGAPHDDAAVQDGLFGDRTLAGKAQTEMLPETAGQPRADMKAGKITPEEIQQRGRELGAGAETPKGERPLEMKPSAPEPSDAQALADRVLSGELSMNQAMAYQDSPTTAEIIRLVNEARRPDFVHSEAPEAVARPVEPEQAREPAVEPAPTPRGDDTPPAGRVDTRSTKERTPEPLRRKYGKLSDDEVVDRWNQLQGDLETRTHEHDAAKSSPSARRRNEAAGLGAKIVKIQQQVLEAEDVLRARGMDPEAMWNDPAHAARAQEAAKNVRPDGVSAENWRRLSKMTDDEIRAEHDRRSANHQRLVEYADRGEKPNRKASGPTERGGSRFAAIQAQQEELMLRQIEKVGKQRGLSLSEHDRYMAELDAADAAEAAKKKADDDEYDRIAREARDAGEGGAVHPAVVKSIAGAGVGAVAGAASDKEHPLRGAIIGGMLGLGAVNAPAGVRAFLDTPIGRRMLTGAGDMPVDVFERHLKNMAEKAANDVRLSQTLRDVRAALRIEFGGKPIPQGTLEAMNDAMHGQPAAALPPRLHRIVGRLRSDLDAWSRELIDSGAATGDMADVIESNMGQYVNRSYRIFDDRAYGDRIRAITRAIAEGKPVKDSGEKRLVNKTIAYLWQEMAPGLAQQNITGASAANRVLGTLGELLDKNVDSPIGALRQAKMGAKDLSIFKHREDIAPEIRALWGEYDNPLVNYARSVHKMASMVSNHRFLEDVRSAGVGKFLHQEPTGIFTRQIAADQSSVMAPLNGLYTTPEIEDAFRKSFTGSNPPTWLRYYMRANGFVTMGKTVLSPVAAIRNVLGNVGFAVSNGHFSHGFEALKATVAAMNLPGKAGAALDTPAMRSYLADLTERGVIGQSTHAGELADILRDAGAHDDLGGLLSGLDLQAETASEVARGVVGKVKGAATTFYALGDDLWKINGYESELARYQKALPFADVEAVKGRAARMTQDLYPTYSRIARGVKDLRRFPAIGQFVSFPAEVIRTTKNLLETTARELRDPEGLVREIAPNATPAQVAAGAKGIRAIGATRLTGALAVAAGVPGIVAASRLLTGVSRQDEADLRLSLPPWQQNHSLLHLGRKADGTFRMIDLSYSDPHALLRAPLLALMAGENWHDKLTGAIEGLTQPFTQEEILFGAGVDVLRNQTAEGHEINNPEAPALDRFIGNVGHIAQAMEPGGLTTGRRIYKAARGEVSPGGRKYELGTEVLATMTGQRVSSVDVPQALGSAAARYLRETGDAHRLLTETVTRRGTVPDDEIATAYRKSDESRSAIFDRMARMVQAARNLGVPTGQVMQVLESRGLSQSETADLMAGVYFPAPPSEGLSQTPADRESAVNPENTGSAFGEAARRDELMIRGWHDALDRARENRARRPAPR